MKQKRVTRLVLGLVTLWAMVGIVNAAPAQYEMDWWTVDGGGGTLSGGTYSLSGTVGQADVGPAMEGGPYRLVAGYWYGAAAEQSYKLYLPSMLRNH